jgi:alkylation response protein AidB-like acyl-CoA dehydrogenase
MSDLRDEVTQWLDEHWDPARSVDEWWRIVAAAGWTAPHFAPDQGGRGLPLRAQATVRATFAEYGALRPPGGLGLLLAAPTMLTHGTPDQIERLVTPILEGQIAWCQLFSEPDAGSDLAGLKTRAVRDGDHWVVTGQKVWSSDAMGANYGMLLARTDFGVPKHAGISWFAFSLDQPGVEVRPLREMTGEALFNEVFIDGAVVDDANLIGGAGNGWAVTQTTLHFERMGIGAGGAHAGFPAAGPKGGMLGRTAGEAARDEEPGGVKTLGLPELIEWARKTGRTSDPHLRQKLAELATLLEVGHWNALRGKAEAAQGGGQSVASIGKILQTRIMKLSSEIGVDTLGAHGLLAGNDAPDDGDFVAAFLFAPASSIYGGTDQIQRNIAAERSLGLPRELLPFKGEPFEDVLRATARDA